MEKYSFDAILPCRVTGTRLYGKPLQLIDIENNVTILEYLSKYIEKSEYIRSFCLAISEETENYGFIRLAKLKGWNYVLGDPLDVLGRMVKAINKYETENVLLISTENPFMYNERIDELFFEHRNGDHDFSMFSDLPEGSSFAIIKSEALVTSHKMGNNRHRSELVTSYIFDNKNNFSLNIKEPKKKLMRSDVRITVDYPEDLILCRKIYHLLNGKNRLIPINDIIEFWDNNEDVCNQVKNIGIDWGHGRLWK